MSFFSTIVFAALPFLLACDPLGLLAQRCSQWAVGLA